MLEHVHKQVNKEDKEGFFTYAVGPEKAPDYYKLIEHPMDLNTIKYVWGIHILCRQRTLQSQLEMIMNRRKRLQGRYYTPEEGGIEQFEHDMYLIFRNCRSYNPTEAAEVAEANRLQEIANHKLRIGKDVLLKRLWESSYTTEEVCLHSLGLNPFVSLINGLLIQSAIVSCCRKKITTLLPKSWQISDKIEELVSVISGKYKNTFLLKLQRRKLSANEQLNIQMRIVHIDTQ